jgi:hypothetical protein
VRGVLKNTLVVIGVTILIGGAALAQLLFRFDLAMNPVAVPIRHYSHPWGKMTDLTPSPFEIGTPRDTVVKKLANFGFEETPAEAVWGRYKSEVRDGFELFQREGDDLICRIQIYAFVKFDSEGRLSSAKGTWHEHGCP